MHLFILKIYVNRNVQSTRYFKSMGWRYSTIINGINKSTTIDTAAVSRDKYDCTAGLGLELQDSL
jgi:hypothetical protein